MLSLTIEVDMHLLVDISDHGLGHLAQMAQIVNELRLMTSELKFTVRSSIPQELLRRRLLARFEHIHEASDFGFVMHNAVDIDLAASAALYREWHANWPHRVADEAAWLKSHRIDAVLTNASYLPLTGAAQAGIPAFCASSLNWAGLYKHYFSQEPGASQTHAEMLAAYNSARRFYRITPGLPMEDLNNRCEVGPVARVVARDRDKVGHSLGIADHERWILVAMGGVAFRLPLENWRPRPGIRWIVPADWRVTRHDVSMFDWRRLEFPTLIASADAVITKPGYGTFVEAACAGIPILYLERNDWPETPHFAAWLGQHARASELSRSKLMAGDIVPALDALLELPAPPKPGVEGADQIARGLLTELGIRIEE
jgi:hypothetical protein